jgi:uncharacterized membrane protein YkvA (DUF1232 family)
MEVDVHTFPEQSHQTLAKGMKSRIKRLFEDFRVIRRALSHPQVPWYAKVVAGCAVVYVFSPIQLIPNFIPVIGQMDDVLVVSLGIKFLRGCVPLSVLEECQNKSQALVIPLNRVTPLADPLSNLEL